ncbi:hypothetical protein ACKWTF_004388 [Chironomus riparius]
MSIDNDCESELDRTEVMCDDIEKNVATVREMIKNKDDAYTILEKLTDDFANFYKCTRDKFNKLNFDNSNRLSRMNNQIVSLENNLYEKINVINDRTEEKINSIEVSQKCSKENSILWISFTDPKEVEHLRLKNKSELIKEAKQIFARMEIWMNGMNRQIYDVFIQKVSVKSESGFTNETLLGVKFFSHITVLELKRLITDYAKKQFFAKNFDAIRYTARDNWSPMIWKILRVCYDLSSFNLIENAHVSETGIQVFYTRNETSKDGKQNQIQMRSIVRSESDLDNLRKIVGDICCELPTFRVYDGNYFKLSAKERKIYKEKIKKVSAQEDPVFSNLSAQSDVESPSS